MFRVSFRSFCVGSAIPTKLPLLATYSRQYSSEMSSAVKAAQTTLAENLGGVTNAVAPSNNQFSLDDVPDQTGKVAVVTGGSEGIGYGIHHPCMP